MILKYTLFWRQACLLIGVMLVVSGCSIGQEAKSTPKPTLVKPSPTLKATRTPSVVSFQIKDLLSVRGLPILSCLPALSSGTLALATKRLTYDQAEKQQIVAYVDSLDSAPPSPPLPNTLQYLPGSAPQDMMNAKEDALGETWCSAPLTVTNISQEPLQIPQINLRYLSDATPNTLQYRLINVCSIGIWDQGICPQPRGGRDYQYGSNFTIDMEPRGTVYTSQLSIGEPVIALLQPGQLASINIGITIKNMKSGLFTTAIPEVVVETPSAGQQTLSFAPMRMDIALAAPESVSCYALKGNTFVAQEVVSGVTKRGLPSWCV